MSDSSETELMTAWTHVLVRALDLSPDAVNRTLMIMNAFLSQISASSGFLSLTSLGAEGEGPQMLRRLDLGLWEPEAKSSRDAYASNPNAYPDPFVTEYIRRGIVDKPCVARRQDCVSDAEWYSSDHYKIHRVRANQDACMYATMPALDNDDAVIAPGTFWTACACRETGERQFSERERDWFGQCFFSLTPILFEVYKTPVTERDNDLAKLPLRLRKVVGYLMNGDSEKIVASKLGLSQHTVHGYIKELYTRFNVQSRPELLVRLLR